jgi:hypothetical protein
MAINFYMVTPTTRNLTGPGVRGVRCVIAYASAAHNLLPSLPRRATIGDAKLAGSKVNLRRNIVGGSYLKAAFCWSI